MPSAYIQVILDAIDSLSALEQRELHRQLGDWYDRLSGVMDSRLIDDLRDARFPDGVHCPYCDHKETRRYGKTRGKQRYQCKKCKRTFSDLFRSPVAYSKHQDKWTLFARCMMQGMSIRKTAEKLGVNPTTIFRWRHKLLAGLRKLDFPTLKGIVEVDETYIRESQKGSRHLNRKRREHGKPVELRGISRQQVCVLVARDREERMIADKVGFGRITKAQLNAALKISSGSELCSDGASAYQAYCREHELTHHPYDAKKQYKQPQRKAGMVYHIQHVNSFHSRFKGWMKRFHGVATRYLPNYITWHQFVDEHKKSKEEAAFRELLITACRSLKV